MKIEKLKINIFLCYLFLSLKEKYIFNIIVFYICKKIYLFWRQNSNSYIYGLHYKKRATFIPDYFINYILLASYSWHILHRILNNHMQISMCV